MNKKDKQLAKEELESEGFPSETADEMVSAMARQMGKRGGDATKAKYGSDYFKRIRKLSSGRKAKLSQKVK